MVNTPQIDSNSSKSQIPPIVLGSNVIGTNDASLPDWEPTLEGVIDLAIRYPKENISFRWHRISLVVAPKWDSPAQVLILPAYKILENIWKPDINNSRLVKLAYRMYWVIDANGKWRDIPEPLRKSIRLIQDPEANGFRIAEFTDGSYGILTPVFEWGQVPYDSQILSIQDPEANGFRIVKFTDNTHGILTPEFKWIVDSDNRQMHSIQNPQPNGFRLVTFTDGSYGILTSEFKWKDSFRLSTRNKLSYNYTWGYRVIDLADDREWILSPELDRVDYKGQNIFKTVNVTSDSKGFLVTLLSGTTVVFPFEILSSKKVAKNVSDSLGTALASHAQT
jgi:hypothetical protein